MTRKKTEPPSGKARKPLTRKKAIGRPSDADVAQGEAEKPISAFSENTGASWPTPDNLNNPPAIDNRDGQRGGEGPGRDPKGKPRAR
jgi:hypothetical protein